LPDVPNHARSELRVADVEAPPPSLADQVAGGRADNDILAKIRDLPCDLKCENYWWEKGLSRLDSL